MAFPLPGLSVQRVFTGGLVAVIGCVAATASEATAAPPSRAERLVIRRLERIEVLERRAEAAAEMPPRPADVRRMLRRGVPLSEIMPKAGSGSPAAARRPVTPPARAAAPPTPSPAETAARAQPAKPPRAFAPAPAATAATAAAEEPTLRFPEQPATAQEPALPAAGSSSAVAPATALDDGTRSVLVREKPTPAPPAELLPTPQQKQ
jgi:hypothetical protein